MLAPSGRLYVTKNRQLVKTRKKTFTRYVAEKSVKTIVGPMEEENICFQNVLGSLPKVTHFCLMKITYMYIWGVFFINYLMLIINPLINSPVYCQTPSPVLNVELTLLSLCNKNNKNNPHLISQRSVLS